MVTKKTYKTIFKLRRATEAEWKEKNPVLALGEPGFAYDVYGLKIGNGETPWNQLEYIGAEGEEVTINGVPLVGNLTSADLNIDQTYIYSQEMASNEWIIQHNLKKFPSVSVIDSGGTCVIGDVKYIDNNTLICIFKNPFSGKAYLN